MGLWNGWNENSNQSRLTVDRLRVGLEHGHFPMADHSDNIILYSVNWRCLLPIEGIHVSRRLAQKFRQGKFAITTDRCFEKVMRGCIRPEDNWISEELIELYCEAHRRGWAHSCEVWDGEELAGGIYGVTLGTVFSGESMFSRRTDASKIGLHHFLAHLRSLGFTHFDSQFINDHTESLGAYCIEEEEYLDILDKALLSPIEWQNLEILGQSG